MDLSATTYLSDFILQFHHLGRRTILLRWNEFKAKKIWERVDMVALNDMDCWIFIWVKRLAGKTCKKERRKIDMVKLQKKKKTWSNYRKIFLIKGKSVKYSMIQIDDTVEIRVIWLYHYCWPEGPYIYKVLDHHKIMFILTR